VTVPSDQSRATVAVGGVGGSGTRVVAQVLGALGLHLGEDLNEALDNLWFTLLFKHREILDFPPERFARYHGLFVAAMQGDPQQLPDADRLRQELLGFERAGLHGRSWLKARWDSLMSPRTVAGAVGWGWKEPNTHMVLEPLLALQPELRYVHVMRNGLDMAFSANQNQLRLWGPRALGRRFDTSPRASLAFWRWAHERVFALAARHPRRVLVLDFDRLCRAPAEELSRLTRSLGLPTDPTRCLELARLVRTPATVGRFRSADPQLLDQEDVRYVAGLGFETRW
jgi:hypothetical protein